MGNARRIRQPAGFVKSFAGCFWVFRENVCFADVKSILSLVAGMLFLWANAVAQTPSPYRIARAEAWAAPLTALFAGAGWAAQANVEPFGPAELALLDPNRIPAFDRWNAGNWHPKAARVSDISVGAAIAAPLAVFASRPARHDFWKVALMGAEAGLTSFGLVNTAKGVFQRARPFA
ncbi:MAG TPA: hypothetical protein VHS96_04510 [Bacteroidia bacterium]|nr:hypothetical protein [Bacteroidia bacterium]